MNRQLVNRHPEQHATGEQATGEQATGEQATGEQATAATSNRSALQIVEFEGLQSESISL